MKNKTLSLTFAAILAASFYSSPVQSKSQLCRVINTQGDYIKAKCSNKIHYYALAYLALPVEGQPFYKRSQSALALLRNQLVTITPAYKKGDTVAALVYKKNKNFNIAMLRSGFSYLSKASERNVGYVKAQQFAQKNKIGVWSQPNPMNPHAFIEQHARIERIKTKLKFSPEEKEAFSKLYIGDKRTKLVYKASCLKILTIPQRHQQIFATSKAPKLKGWTVKETCSSK